MKITDLINKNALRNLAPATSATPATYSSRVASVANVAKQDHAINDCDDVKESAEKNSADAYCWPHSIAMNSAEINQTRIRLERLIQSGLDIIEAEKLCDRLLRRDREGLATDIYSCFECKNLVVANGWFCRNWKMAEVAHRAKDSQLPTALVVLLQRCFGFSPRN
jgi:hypothetical protein